MSDGFELLVPVLTADMFDSSWPFDCSIKSLCKLTHLSKFDLYYDDDNMVVDSVQPGSFNPII